MSLKPINTYIQEMPRSGIRRIMDTAIGHDVLHLEVGQPNFPTPAPVTQAAVKAATDKDGLYTRYTPNRGYVSLRKALVKKLREENGIQSEVDHILITPGSNYGIMIALSVMLNKGDEVLVPDPGYVNYTSLPPQFGGVVKPYPLRVSSEFAPEIETIVERITSKTKVIVHNSPSNPTGAVCSEAFVRGLVDVARAHDLYILSDETYEHILFEGRHFSPAKYDEEGRVISLFSFSKSYAMTGWRVGYVVANDSIAEALEKQQELCVSCAPSISQKAAEAALEHGNPYIRDMVEQYRRRRDLALGILKKHNLFSYTPHGAFYVLVDISRTEMESNVFADRLLNQQRVAVAPGATFGESARRYIRISLAAEERVVAEGLEKICAFIKQAL
jgi:aspartate/methionine/tyrosine aminotransferase